MPWHVVAQGECVNSIAVNEGFFWSTIWNASENAGLKQKRKSPDVLLEGDRLFIPDKQLKQISCATDNRYKFQRKGVPAKLRLQLLDAAHKPRANLSYVLTVDGFSKKGVTDSNGMVIQSIPPDAQKGTLDITDGKKTQRMQLRLGHLNPSDDLTGTQHRLKNLGYSIPQENGTMDDHTTNALKQFQQKYSLPVTGNADSATLSKLQSVHGG